MAMRSAMPTVWARTSNCCQPVLRQLPGWFTDYNTEAPHSALAAAAPREARPRLAHDARSAGPPLPAHPPWRRFRRGRRPFYTSDPHLCNEMGGRPQQVAVAVVAELGLPAQRINDLRALVQGIVLDAGLLPSRVDDTHQATDGVRNVQGSFAEGVGHLSGNQPD